MIFTKTDRARLELMDAKLDAIQAHLAGATLRGLSENDGKLLAALNEVQADYKDWACWRVELAGKLDAATDAKCDRITLEAAIKYHLKRANEFKLATAKLRKKK